MQNDLFGNIPCPPFSSFYHIIYLSEIEGDRNVLRTPALQSGVKEHNKNEATLPRSSRSSGGASLDLGVFKHPGGMEGTPDKRAGGD